jgi:hypothetical protein
MESTVVSELVLASDASGVKDSVPAPDGTRVMAIAPLAASWSGERSAQRLAESLEARTGGRHPFVIDWIGPRPSVTESFRPAGAAIV